MLSNDEISRYVRGEKKLDMLSELFATHSAGVFYDAEERVLDSLEPCRESALRLLEYLKYMDSIYGYECLICTMWEYLTDEEKNTMRKRAREIIEPDLLELWGFDKSGG